MSSTSKSNLCRMIGVGVMAFILFLSTLVGAPVLPDLAKALGAGATEIPIVSSAALATVVIVQLFTGVLADRYARRTLILIGALLGGASSLLCTVASDWRHLVALRVSVGSPTPSRCPLFWRRRPLWARSIRASSLASCAVARDCRS